MKDIEKLFKESTNKLYNDYFANNKFVKKNKDNIYQTWNTRYKKPSINSFSFVKWDGKMKKDELMEDEKKALYKVFKFKDKEIFENKFDQAVSGGGQEWTRITTLHSSSLAALLCFYSVWEKKSLTIENLPIGKCEFTECEFESKNMVGKDKTGKTHYSNVDVVLKGKTTDDKKVILFLESKFSEYLHPGKKDDISGEVYNKIYNELTKNATEQPINELLFLNEGNTWTISYSNKKKPMYCEGIKQMISHFQGIEESFIGSICDTFDYIYLGEIVFNFPEELDKEHKKFNSYSTMYMQLAKKLNEINDEKRFHVLPNLLTYQEVFKNFDLDKNVRAFYQLPLAQ